MAFNVNAFRSKLAGGGARPNMFEVILTAPAYVGFNTEQFSFMCRATAVPQSTVGEIAVPYFGRTIKVGGDRTFEDWSVAVINDETYDLRGMFEKWSNSIAAVTTATNNQRTGGATANPNSYVSKALVQQLGKEGKVIKKYEMINIWPTNVSGIELAWDNNNSIEEFQVTFAYDYFNTDTVT